MSEFKMIEQFVPIVDIQRWWMNLVEFEVRHGSSINKATYEANMALVSMYGKFNPLPIVIEEPPSAD